jgi:hypothetical protein
MQRLQVNPTKNRTFHSLLAMKFPSFKSTNNEQTHYITPKTIGYIHGLICDSITDLASDTCNARALRNEPMILEVLEEEEPTAFRQDLFTTLKHYYEVIQSMPGLGGHPEPVKYKRPMKKRGALAEPASANDVEAANESVALDAEPAAAAAAAQPPLADGDAPPPPTPLGNRQWAAARVPRRSEYTRFSMIRFNAWCLLSKITQKPLGPGGVDAHIDEFAIYQLEESINFATTRHEPKTVLNDVISVTASMQTQETKWNDSDQAFISKSRSCRISTIIDQLDPLIDDPLLLSDYPTQKGSDLPAMGAWISASTSPPGRVFGRKVCSAYGRPQVWSAD